MRTLVAGLGNVFEGDDGFGVAVVAALAGTSWPDGVEVQDYGIRGVHLAYQLLDGYDLIVIVDAVARDGAPGTVYLIEHSADADPASADRAPMLDAHDLVPDAVLALVPRLGGTLGRVVIVGCQPATLGPAMGLSSVVAGSVDTATRLVVEIVREAHSAAGEPPAAVKRFGSEAIDDGKVPHLGDVGRRGRRGRGLDARPQAVPEDALDVTVR